MASDYLKFNFQRLLNSNMTVDNISEFAGSFNDIVRRTDFAVDADDLSKYSNDSIATAYDDMVTRTDFDVNFSPNSKLKNVQRVGARDNSQTSKFSYHLYVIVQGSPIVIFETGDGIVITPDNLSESTSASYNPQSFIGRSAPSQVYTGTGARSLSVTFKLHYEMSSINSPRATASKIKELKRKLNDLRAVVYPKLLGPGYVPCLIELMLGHFKIYGICTQVSYNWQPPIINDEFSVCEVSLSIDQVLPPNFGGVDSILGKSEPQNPFN